MLEKAKRVFFFGIGDSLNTAMEARNKFIRTPRKSELYYRPAYSVYGGIDYK